MIGEWILLLLYQIHHKEEGSINLLEDFTISRGIKKRSIIIDGNGHNLF
jgi:hypothetical protein